jgi:DNA-3-methyladenine glycosylase
MSAAPRPLPRAFYARRALDVARDVIGTHLLRRSGGRLRIGRIVEAEAYQGPQDLASHASRGRTARTDVMFGPPGHAYVYLVYGMWDCFNIVTAPEGVPHAVLIRAVEPVAGLMQKTSGPGLVCRAMGIDRRLNGADLCGASVWLAHPIGPSSRPVRLGRGPRIGVDYAGRWAERPWRFFDRDSPFLSASTLIARASRER